MRQITKNVFLANERIMTNNPTVNFFFVLSLCVFSMYGCSNEPIKVTLTTTISDDEASSFGYIQFGRKAHNLK